MVLGGFLCGCGRKGVRDRERMMIENILTVILIIAVLGIGIGAGISLGYMFCESLKDISRRG